MSELNFNLRINDLEVSSCGKHLLKDGKHERAEISKWNGGTRYIVAYWNRGKEGYDLVFVGDRPFSLGMDDEFFHIARIGQQVLTAYFDQTTN